MPERNPLVDPVPGDSVTCWSPTNHRSGHVRTRLVLKVEDGRVFYQETIDGLPTARRSCIVRRWRAWGCWNVIDINGREQ